jgi:hypothetical protein
MAEPAFKPEKDYSKDVDKALPEAEKLSKVGQHRRHVFAEYAN